MVEKIVQDWLKNLKFNEPVMIKKKGNILIIITRRPGWLIGPRGRDVDNLKDRLSKYRNDEEWSIEFIEADEIIYTPDTVIDTRDFDEILLERIEARFQMWGMEDNRYV